MARDRRSRHDFAPSRRVSRPDFSFLIPEHQRGVPGFDERILALYARGMSTREIAAHLEEMFGAEVSPTLVSAITDTVAVADEARA